MAFFCDNASDSLIFFSRIEWNEVIDMFFGNLFGCSGSRDRDNTWWIVIIAIIVLYFLFFDRSDDSCGCPDPCHDPCRDRCC